MFPPRAASSQTSPLDGPPPSPQSMGAGPTGQPTQFSLEALAPPVPAAQLPPETLTSMIQASQRIKAMYDSFAQITPDMAADWGMLKEQLETVLAKLLMQGAGATSPTASGSQFPGGGFDRGIAGAGTI